MTIRLDQAFICVGLLLYVGCSGTESSGGPAGVGGTATSGGAASTGGSTDAGGAIATGGATGGVPTIGGSANVGGMATGGALGTGGAVTTGGTTGSAATGGVATTGGAKTSGGASAAGGANATGGSRVTGGSSTTGGTSTAASKNTGGTAATGGNNTGGASATGGIASTGGNKSTGGSTAAGGSGTCVPSTCGSHNWACWHMPNPAGLGLPNVASYTDLGDGTIRDNITCLVWQKGNLADSTGNTFTFAAAQTACAASTVAGRTWRTATRVELTSIDDFSRTSGVAINTTYFTALSGYTWTATPWVVSQIATKPQDAWMINFSDGLTSSGAAQSGAYYTRCVTNGDGTTSSPPVIPPNLYTTIATGEIQDNYTGLIWQQADSVSTMAQADATTYCANLGLNGHTWRLPSVHEIATLVDDNPPITKVSPATNQTVFSTTAPSTPYWTSSLYKGQAVAAHAPWTLTFTDGFTNYSNTAAIAKCVR